MTSVLTMEAVSKSIGNKPILDGISIQVAAEEIAGLIGDNGAGKTTLIRCICGLYEVTSGSISLYGQSPHRMSDVVKQRLGVVFDTPCLIPEMSALDNLLYFCAPYGLSRQSRQVAMPQRS